MQLRQALSELAATTSPDDVGIHRVRRRSKRIRALLRMLRVAAPRKSRRASWLVRDASAILSPFRDAQIVPAAAEKAVSILRAQGTQIDSALLEWLTRLDAGSNSSPGQLSNALSQSATQLTAARDVVAKIKIKSKSDLSPEALSKMYSHGRSAVTQVIEDGRAESFHELRKCVKAYYYQSRFLKRDLPKRLRSHIERAKRLGDTLGQMQDLAVLQKQLDNLPENLDRDSAQTLGQACRQLANVRQDEATGLACQLFFYDPSELLKSRR